MDGEPEAERIGNLPKVSWLVSGEASMLQMSTPASLWEMSQFAPSIKIKIWLAFIPGFWEIASKSLEILEWHRSVFVIQELVRSYLNLMRWLRMGSVTRKTSHESQGWGLEPHAASPISWAPGSKETWKTFLNHVSKVSISHAFVMKAQIKLWPLKFSEGS